MLASGVLLGVALGLAFRGDIRRLGEIRLRWLPLLVIAVSVRFVAAPLIGDQPVLYVVPFAAIVLVGLANRTLPGALTVAAAAALNLAVVAANGGMPVSSVAVAIVGGAFPRDSLHVELTQETRFAYLADVIPVPLVRGVYSAGDVALAAGGFWIPFVTMRRSVGN